MENQFLHFIHEKYYLENKKKIILLLFISLILYPLQNVAISKIVNSIFSKIREKEKVKWLLILISLIIFLISIFIYFKNLIETNLISNFNLFLEKEIFNNILNSKMESYEDINMVEYTLFSEKFNFQFKYIFHKIINFFIPFTCIILGIILYFLYLSPIIGIFLLLISLFFYFYFKKVYEIIFEKLNIKNSMEIENKKNIQNKFHNLENIYLQNQTENEKNKNENVSLFLKKKSDIIFKFTCNIFAIFLFILFLFISFILYYNFKYNFKKSPYIFTMVLLLIITFFNQLFSFFGNFIDLVYKLSSLNIHKKYFEKFIQFDFSSKKLKKINTIKNGNITFKNITFSYNNKTNVFKNYSTTIKAKQTTAILGPSGKGKTTLVKLLMKLYKVQNGSIYIDSIPLENYDTISLRNQITFLNQKTHLFEKSVYENIIYGSTNHISQKQVENFLIQHNFDKQFIPILHNHVGLDGNNMSLGTQKLIMIFRTILTKPQAKIYILDEPFSSLDLENVQKIFKMIQNIMENNGKTFIIITHDSRILPLCQSVIKI